MNENIQPSVEAAQNHLNQIRNDIISQELPETLALTPDSDILKYTRVGLDAPIAAYNEKVFQDFKTITGNAISEMQSYIQENGPKLSPDKLQEITGVEHIMSRFPDPRNQFQPLDINGSLFQSSLEIVIELIDFDLIARSTTLNEEQIQFLFQQGMHLPAGLQSKKDFVGEIEHAGIKLTQAVEAIKIFVTALGNSGKYVYTLTQPMAYDLYANIIQTHLPNSFLGMLNYFDKKHDLR